MKGRILSVEDFGNPVGKAGHFLVGDQSDCCLTVHPETVDEFIAHLRRKDFDLIWTRCELPGVEGLKALELARRYVPEVPFIFASRSLDPAVLGDSIGNDGKVPADKDGSDRKSQVTMDGPVSQPPSQGSEKRLQQAESLQAVGTLAGGIAHDFNNILTIIKGHASLLERESRRPKRVCEVATIIDHAARRGTDLVKEMLAFAQKSEGIFSLCDFNKLVREAADMLKGSIPQQITLEFAFDESLPEFMVDAGQVERIVLNLIGNARDAMPRGGRIVVSTARITDSVTVPGLVDLPAREYAFLQISDNGEGMDEKIRSRIFEPFFTTKPKGKGTGLGMPVVYGVMQMHHGTIEVVSAPGKGTSMELYFPLVLEADHRGACRKMAATQISRGSETLLIVDDEPDVLSFLQALLEAEGYRVLTAENAEEALPLFCAHQSEIKLVFSDLGLPTLNGYELCEKLRRIKPNLKALLGSGYADNEIKRRVHENEDTEFISKPYSPANIFASIRHILDEGVQRSICSTAEKAPRV